MKFTHASGDRPLAGYTLQHGVGRGGFGEVYQAVSDGGKQVALKLVQRNLDVELRGVGQCLNLKHPNLVSVHDVKQAENGDQWIVMEHVHGETLDKVIARHPQGLPQDEVLARSQPRPMEEALGAAHFELGQYLYRHGQPELAVNHFRQAHRLQPDNWTYKRQAWSLVGNERLGGGEFGRFMQVPLPGEEGDWPFDSNFDADVAKLQPGEYFPKTM